MSVVGEPIGCPSTRTNMVSPGRATLVSTLVSCPIIVKGSPCVAVVGATMVRFVVTSSEIMFICVDAWLGR